MKLRGGNGDLDLHYNRTFHPHAESKFWMFPYEHSAKGIPLFPFANRSGDSLYRNRLRMHIGSVGIGTGADGHGNPAVLPDVPVLCGIERSCKNETPSVRSNGKGDQRSVRLSRAISCKYRMPLLSADLCEALGNRRISFVINSGHLIIPAKKNLVPCSSGTDRDGHAFRSAKPLPGSIGADAKGNFQISYANRYSFTFSIYADTSNFDLQPL